ncbi:alpha/beta fold hydrolase [Cryobacterium sp. TMT3-29-2]|uniref:alpha/beta fold hydrolase n=1 Tax=Cryobacterium sp. TMT3-29-2 TaxID=2555867 RepID=UPI001073978B|nr:alpha/beta hydrolase [Cryobacterium sp. TMT3-29-2]TFC93754.1 alpha/beta hydrolase [Cryobacterium sp. TMT3-29-2]
MSVWERRSRRRPGSAPADEAVSRDRALPDRDWTVLPAGSRAFRFAAPSGYLAAFELGDPAAPRIVLVPGATGSKEDFVLLAPLLADAGYFVQSHDLAGQYQSHAAGPDGTAPWDYALFVADLIAFLEAGSTPTHVLGYSFAGIVAELALAERPELFASLVLLGVPPQPGQAFRRVRWIGPLSQVLPPRRIAELIIWGIIGNLNRMPPGRLALVRLRFGLTSRRSVDEIVGLMKRMPDLRAVLRRTPIPCLVAVGDRDVWPVELHRRFARRIGADIRVYRTGHSPCETTPNQLARDLLALYRAV